MWNKNKETENSKKPAEPASDKGTKGIGPHSECGKDTKTVEPEKAPPSGDVKDKKAGELQPGADKIGVEPHSGDEKDSKIAGLTDALLRLQAEFENYKKRVEREKAEIFKIASMGLLTELLTILDDFERVPTAEIKDEKIRKGVEMIAGNFRKVLEGEGVKQIPAEGTLDPHKHEALMWAEQKGVPEGTIISVLQKGYSLNGKILRPARVSVSKKPEKIQDNKKDIEHKKMEELK